MNTNENPPKAPPGVQEAPASWNTATGDDSEGTQFLPPSSWVNMPREDWEQLTSFNLQDVAKQAMGNVVGSRIRKARGGMTREQLAGLMGIHENTLGKMERGLSLPDALQLAQLSGLLQRPVLWLMGEDGDTPAQTAGSIPARSPQAVEVGDLIYVPLFDLRASAGHGAFNDAEHVLFMRAFAVDYIRRDLHILHNQLALVTVVGNSMEPDIHSGDVVLIDRKDKDISVEGPHLVRIDGSLLVKLVQRRPGGVLRVASKNETYEPFDINLMSSDLRDFEVLGRVRWAGVTFK